jgi:hypothetical protein
MGLFENLQKEIDRAGTVARQALDEGKLRLDLFRVRRLADDAATALGYAVHRARKDGKEPDAETMQRLDATVKQHTDEEERIEAELARIRAECEARDARQAPAGEEPATAGASAAGGAAPAAGTENAAP